MPQYIGNWGIEYYPPPYQFMFQGVPAPQRAPILPRSPGMRLSSPGLSSPGLSGCGCGCSGGCGGSSTHNHNGMGLFESFDIASWSWMEWAAIAGALYVGMSLFGDTRRVVKRVRSSRAQSSARSKRIAEARQRLREAEAA